MDWERATEEERAALKRIVALLFSLAGLAELAAGRSPAVRLLVLWLLRHGAAAAQKLVAGKVEASLASTPVVPVGGTPADAMRLAASLRALARLIDLQAGSAFDARRAHRDGNDPQASGPAAFDVLNAVCAAMALAVAEIQPPRAPDTS